MNEKDAFAKRTHFATTGTSLVFMYPRATQFLFRK